jgi:hypothetical protein
VLRQRQSRDPSRCKPQATRLYRICSPCANLPTYSDAPGTAAVPISVGFSLLADLPQNLRTQSIAAQTMPCKVHGQLFEIFTYSISHSISGPHSTRSVALRFLQAAYKHRLTRHMGLASEAGRGVGEAVWRPNTRRIVDGYGNGSVPEGF